MFRILFSIFCMSSAMIFGQNTSNTEMEKISQLMESFNAAWNAKNAKALASLWVDDGDLITPWGRWIRGRNQIEKYFVQESDGPLSRSTLQQSIDSSRFLNPTLILADTTFTLSGVSDLRFNEPASFSQHGTFVIAKVNDQWKIMALRMFQFQPPIPN